MATSIFREYFKGYEILGELGRGNARVLKARSIQTGELVAIKHFAFNTEPDTLRRFQRESEIMKSIQHDYIVKVFEVHLDAELPYIVMQLVEGGDLRSLLRNHGSLDVPTVIRLAHHMTEALDAIHAKAVVHRDVKPENIMYRRHPNGEIQFLLTDFGIAKLREQSDGITATGASMLTYDYASPEQFNQSRNVSTPTDYYSLGVVIYECLTGRVPFEYEQDDLLMHINRVISSPIPIPLLPDGRPLPPSLLQLLHGLLTKPCLIRMSNPVNVRQLLRMAAIEDMQAQRPLPVPVPKETLKYAPATVLPDTRRRDLTLMTLLLLVICVAVFYSYTTLVSPNTITPVSSPPGKNSLPSRDQPAKPKQNFLQQDKKGLPVLHSNTNNQTVIVPVVSVTPEVRKGVALTNGIYYADFSDPRDSVWDTGRDDNSDFNLSDGKYVMKGNSDSLSYSSSVKFNMDIYKDFTIAASTLPMNENTGNPFGLNFCGDEEHDSYYVFYITSTGYYSIGALIDGEWHVLVDWTPSSHIHTDSEMNLLAVEKRGSQLRFLINDKLERILPFTSGFGSYFGLRVDGAQTVSFDQFLVKGSL